MPIGRRVGSAGAVVENTSSALLFSDGQYIETGLVDSSANYSVSLWVKKSALDAGFYVSQRGGGGNRFQFWTREASTDKKLAVWDGTTTHTGVADTDNNKFIHVGFSFDGSLYRTFIDGVFDNGPAGTVGSSTEQVLLMTDNVGNYCDGAISDFRYYSKKLANEDFATLAANNNGNVLQDSLELWYKFEEGVIDDTVTGAGKVIDSSPNNHTSTVVGNPKYIAFKLSAEDYVYEFQGTQEVHFVTSYRKPGTNVGMEISCSMYKEAAAEPSRTITYTNPATGKYSLFFQFTIDSEAWLLAKDDIDTGRAVEASIAFPLGRWVDVVLTFSASDNKLRINYESQTWATLTSHVSNTDWGLGNVFFAAAGEGPAGSKFQLRDVIVSVDGEEFVNCKCEEGSGLVATNSSEYEDGTITGATTHQLAWEETNPL